MHPMFHLLVLLGRSHRQTNVHIDFDKYVILLNLLRCCANRTATPSRIYSIPEG